MDKAQPSFADSYGGQRDIIYYDGACGLCHALVRRVVAADSKGTRFVFAPLSGAFIKSQLSEQVRSSLPDSIVVQRTNQSSAANDNNETQPALLVESDAVLYIGWQLGGWRKMAAGLGSVIPRAMRDFLYRMVARIRKRLVMPPKDACPVTDPKIMQRFLD